MRFTRFYLFLLLGGVLLLLGPTTALTQPGGGGAPPDGGGGRRGGRGGPGGMGGGNFDPKAMAAMMFNRIANGKDFVTAADLEASGSRRDPAAHDKIQQFMQSQNITNGQLNRDQFAAYMEQRMAERMAGGGGPGGGGGRMRGGPVGGANPGDDDKAAEDWFRRQDKNGDGVLEADEMSPELRAELSKWDTNKNGVIELDEYKEYYKARMAYLRDQNASNPQGGAWDPAQMGQPAEVVEDKRPVVYHAHNLPKELPAWFAQLDKDKDGQIGLYEWKEAGKPIEEFRAMDINGDGFITVEEALHYQKVLAKRNKTEGGPGQPTDVVAAFPGGMPVGGMPGGGQWGQPGGGRGNWGGQPGGGQWGGMPVGQPGGVRGTWGGPPSGQSQPVVIPGGDNGGGRRKRDNGGDNGGGGGRNRDRGQAP